MNSGLLINIVRREAGGWIRLRQDFSNPQPFIVQPQKTLSSGIRLLIRPISKADKFRVLIAWGTIFILPAEAIQMNALCISSFIHH
jgi:hypothetical protein